MLPMLLLAASAASFAGPPLQVAAHRRRAGLDAAPLDLAFLADDRLLALTADALALYALDGDGAPALLSRAPLPGPFLPVRAPAGLIRAASADQACWAMTNGTRQAFLFAIEAEKLVLRERAAALPWPGVPEGLRFLAGTNVLERGDERLARIAEGWSVLEDGSLALADGATRLRVGSALAPLWEGLALASSPLPPDQPDALLVLKAGADGAEVVQTLAVDGVVRALAAHVTGRRARVAVSLDSNRPGLLLLELTVREP